MSDESHPLVARLNDGRTVPCQPCRCGTCENEFFTPAYSAEWMPSYCPYCGIKFVRLECDGEPTPFKPCPASEATEQGPA